MSEVADFKPGLEGVIAVETEIAEPDREGGVLRYRGVDIEELVGRYPYEQVWGLLVDDDLDSVMPEPEPYEPAGLTGNAPADLQAETARLAGTWGLGKLNEISDEQAREDLGRLSSQMMGIVARSARLADGESDAIRDEVVRRGGTAAERFLLQWRGEADERHVKAIDTYWICTAEHGLNASTFTARVTASTGADCGAALSSAVGALSGPLHGGAPAYVKPMLEEVAAMGDPEKWVRDTLDAGKRIMGFGHRVYRAEDPRSVILKRHCSGARLAADRGRRAARGSRAGGARASSSRTAAEDERRVLLGSRPRRCGDPAAPRTGDVRLLARRRLVGAHPGAEANRPAVQAFCPVRGPRAALTPAGVTLAEAAAEADALAQAGDERALAQLRSQWDEEIEAAARDADYRNRAQAYRAIAQFRFRQKLELLRRGLEDDSPAARGSALIALEGLSRSHPGDVNAFRPLLHDLAARDPNVAVRRLAVVCLRNGTAQRDTIQLLDGIAGSDEEDAELRKTARSVSALLVKKSRAK